ncbi:hypothetical protein LCGC14_0474060 [marine sediment metagenome]|uniref:Uncharacterized protein n=1 Tax=marine sediment metagenome TaxID=412755 RepID=A0A0F9UYA2_9ZZZZ|nr:hypothetical protein [bacterium]
MNERREQIGLSNYLHFYDENIEDKLQKIVSIKSNLLLNLKLFHKQDKIKALKQIAKFELKISDLSFEENKNEFAADSIFSTINSLIEIRKDLCYTIALKGLLIRKFNEKTTQEFFRIIKDLQGSSLSNNYEFFKYIINQYVENSYPFKLQNIIKAPFYIFWKIKFEDILYLKLNPYVISKHPVYSKELSNHLGNLEKNKIVKIKDTILPDLYYRIVRINSNHYRSSVLERKKKLKEIVNNIIEDFAFFKTDQITRWEKDIHILDYYSTAERII